MTRAIAAGGLLLAAAGLGLCEQKGGSKPAPPPRPPASGPSAPKGGGGAGGRNLGPRLTNPASPAARLFLATPEERERAIEKFPPAQQEAIRKNLQYFDSLPKEQQQIMIRRTEKLAELPPEKRRAFMQQMQALNHLPPGRGLAVRGALRRLQMMTDEQRSRVLESDQFKSRFSPEEQKIIADLSEVMLPPM